MCYAMHSRQHFDITVVFECHTELASESAHIQKLEGQICIYEHVGESVKENIGISSINKIYT